MPIGTQDFEYVLDNEFFKNIEGEDVQKGKVKVKLTVKRTAASFELDFDLDGADVFDGNFHEKITDESYV